MSTEKPIVTKAVVELTFASGVTKRLILDDKEVPVGFELSAETDMRETTADDATARSFEQGNRQKVNVHLVGRGPLQLDMPAGDVIVIGPECFASGDESVVCWRGRNYVPQSEPTTASREN